MVADACFAARPSDIIVATLPKSGTTWIKSLLYATVHRREHPVDAIDHPLTSFGPHSCIKFFEYQLYTRNKIPDLDKLPDPRLFATHVPFVSLPRSIATSGCKIVYMCREIAENIVSRWRRPSGCSATACRRSGPTLDHVLGYWRAQVARPEHVLFFMYEEVWRDPPGYVRRLAAFTGLPFDVEEEEENGVVDAIVRLCLVRTLGNSSFFRRGGVGDWAHLSPDSARRIDAITEARFKGVRPQRLDREQCYILCV
ncbi:hypothetical protein HU200_031546 [Digitaria exilis]|uniref:Sulfotransferase n=1 Tax=Digitaria exilis TaxID=1010633 RepID=A0A835EPZ5_9POAL|nr:hypothetical protein HU200_031546 [Digitaria exilis]